MCLPFCHKWKKIRESTKTFHSDEPHTQENMVRKQLVIILQCTKCGTIKFKRL